MIPLAVPNLSGNERKYLNQCIDTTFVSSVGEFVDRMEQMTAEICGARYAVAASSGTTGLHLALTGYGVKSDDIVIIPSFTFIATANAVVHCGAIPWLVDIRRDTWCMDEDQLDRELSLHAKVKADGVYHKESGRRIAAIMPVYTLGNIPDMDWIGEIAARYNLPVLADAACAIGAKYRGKPIGYYGDAAILSFNGNKTVTAGGGGMVVGNDEEMMKKLKHLSTTARVSAEYDFDMVGFNYRMTNIQAAVGCAQLEQLDIFLEKKRRIRKYYEEKLSGIDGIRMFSTTNEMESACWFSGIVFETDGIERVRNISAKLKAKGIESRSFWKPIHLQKPYSKAIRAESLDVSGQIWEKILTLPCSTGIVDQELAYVVDCIVEVL